MIFWLDAQLPPSLAPWLTQAFGVEAYSLRYIGLHTAEDGDIFDRARRAGDVVLISKESRGQTPFTLRAQSPSRGGTSGTAASAASKAASSARSARCRMYSSAPSAASFSATAVATS